ncbi:hypothetical protein [Spirosoma fluviale]|uniref:Uncharacterized protein n=1 Tax=Spirosoma fluviale TaxID=1597977 RepID=A0A286FCB8_9BACT|nr:hypothetical protein [Spirosoma fluviale]SOD80887.1 hypothetical protein SAMN06269250_1600 [Spirosoma fluviale]
MKPLQFVCLVSIALVLIMILCLVDSGHDTPFNVGFTASMSLPFIFSLIVNRNEK